MGQYYYPCILDEEGRVQQSLNSHDYDNGLKLMEHSWLGNAFVQAFEIMLALDGPKRVVWAGDYAEEEAWEIKHPEDCECEEEIHSYHPTLFGLAGDKVVHIDAPGYGTAEYHQTPPADITPPFLVTPESHPFIINHDKRLYVDKHNVKGFTPYWAEGDTWYIHPLPLLTAEGNGRGGGDFGGADPHGLVGSWARDHISVHNAPPPGFDELFFDLVDARS